MITNRKVEPYMYVKHAAAFLNETEDVIRKWCRSNNQLQEQKLKGARKNSSNRWEIPVEIVYQIYEERKMVRFNIRKD